jgi:hypothetical protein
MLRITRFKRSFAHVNPHPAILSGAARLAMALVKDAFHPRVNAPLACDGALILRCTTWDT